MNAIDKRNIEFALNLKDQEIERQIAKRKLAEQTRNWTIILVVIIHLIIWIV